jgi:major membrane immunogen (membrane-anchored lipoprotein)
MEAVPWATWRATVYRYSAFKPNPFTRGLEQLHIHRIHLPCDSYVFRPQYSAQHDLLHLEEDDLETGRKDDRKARGEAVQFVYYITQFIEKYTGLQISDDTKMRASYDFADQRVAFEVLFTGGKLFEINWEYGHHEGATKFSDEEKAIFDKHSRAVHNAVKSASSSTSSTSSTSPGWPPGRAKK